MAISQRVVGLYALGLNPLTIQLNSFARRALSQLTEQFDAELYEDFMDTWGTHIITQSLVGGMVEERAKVDRCIRGVDDDTLCRCIPFSDRRSTGAGCASYASRTKVISKRLLGGNTILNNDYDWKRTLAFQPALLQILEMIPWDHFITNKIVKKNLRTAIRYRLKIANSRRAEAVRQVNAHLLSCASGKATIIHLFSVLSFSAIVFRVAANAPLFFYQCIIL